MLALCPADDLGDMDLPPVFHDDGVLVDVTLYVRSVTLGSPGR